MKKKRGILFGVVFICVLFFVIVFFVRNKESAEPVSKSAHKSSAAKKRPMFSPPFQAVDTTRVARWL